MVTMMQLGAFQFGLDTAVYQELNRSAGWRWAAQERFGARAGQQFTGPDEETISLPGVIFPEWRGGFGQLNEMRALASEGQPLALVAGDGAALGRWIITRVEEVQTVFAPGGKPRRVEFTLELLRFPDAEAETIPTPVAPRAAAALAPGATTAEQSRNLAQSVVGNSGEVVGSLQKASASVNSAVAGYPAEARKALGGVERALSAAQELQAAANDVLATVGLGALDIVALNSIQNFAFRADALLPRAASAQALIQTAATDLETTGGDVPAQSAIQYAHAAATSATALVRQAAEGAAQING